LTFGSRDPDGMSYPLFLGRRLSERHQQTWVTVNLGIPEDGWAEIWRRNYRELLSIPEAGEVLTACHAVLDQCSAAGRFVYLATLPSKRGFGTPREPWAMNETIDALNQAYRQIARDRGLCLVDLTDMPAEMMVDGIHLTQDGNRWVAERFASAIEAWR